MKMQIGIVSIGNDSLELWSVLGGYDHDYILYYDADAWPLGDKKWNRQLEIVDRGVKMLRTQGCEQIIVPPAYELAVGGDDIAGLYSYLVREHALPGSLIGKLGYLTESGHADGKYNHMQTLLMQLADEHTLTDNQHSTRTFHTSMKWRGRDVRQWKYFLRSLSPRNYLIHKVVKFDLRYFKDAHVDTIIGTERSHRAMTKTIKRMFRPSKTKRYDLDILRFMMEEWTPSKRYSVRVLYRGDCTMMTSTRHYEWMLGRGKQIEIQWEEIHEGAKGAKV